MLGLDHLADALDFRLSEVLRVDLAVGIMGGGAAVALALTRPNLLLASVDEATAVVGVVIGAVIAAAAVQAAFMDQSFLKKIAAIGRAPVRYLAPFLFTATIGVPALLFLLVLGAFTPTAQPAVLAAISGVTGWLTFWSVASLLPALDTLVQFVALKAEATTVPEEGSSAPIRRLPGS